MVEKNVRDPQVGHIPDTNRERDIFFGENPQTCPESIPTHLLRILGALRYLKTCFSSYF